MIARGKISERTNKKMNAIRKLSSPYPSTGLERRRWTVKIFETVVKISSPSQKPLERVERSDTRLKTRGNVTSLLLELVM